MQEVASAGRRAVRLAAILLLRAGCAGAFAPLHTQGLGALQSHRRAASAVECVRPARARCHAAAVALTAQETQAEGNGADAHANPSRTRRTREMRGNRALAQWMAAEKKGRVKVVVAASELEFALAQGVMLERSSGPELVDAFDKFDTDGSGSIDVHELESGLRAMGVEPQPADLKMVMNEIDTDNNSEIDFEEFQAMMQATPHVVRDYYNISTALEDDSDDAPAAPTAARIDLTLSGNDLLMDTLSVMQRVVAAHRGSLELVLIKSRTVHELAMRLYAAPRALQRGPDILTDRPAWARPAVTLPCLSHAHATSGRESAVRARTRSPSRAMPPCAGAGVPCNVRCDA